MHTFTVELRPPPEHGIHTAIYSNAAYLRDRGATFASALRFLTGWRNAYTFRRPVPDSEIVDALHAAYRCFRTSHTRTAFPSSAHRPKWPAAEPKIRTNLVDPDFGLIDLWEESPVRFEGGSAHTRAILEAMFPGDPLLCCGWTMERFATNRLSEWGDLDSMQLVVPSPMSKPVGRTKDGSRESAHTLDNTGPRKFLVIDYDDHAGSDVHASASVYLAQKYPLALVLHSGSKSLHAWFYVEGIADDALRSFMFHACQLGADPAMFVRSQFCRMPDGLRGNGKRQTVYYFNPGVLK